MRHWLSILLAVVCSGCAGYKLGPTNGVAAGSRTVKFAPFANKTQVPRITEYMSSALRKQLQNDGTFRLETSGSPDILVTGEITKFDRIGLSYQAGDVLTPQEYTITMTARVKAMNVSTGKIYIDRLVNGTTFLRIGDDETSVERQTVPILTDIVARNAISLLVDGAW
jgi:hypothetical protein